MSFIRNLLVSRKKIHDFKKEKDLDLWNSDNTFRGEYKDRKKIRDAKAVEVHTFARTEARHLLSLADEFPEGEREFYYRRIIELLLIN